MYIEAAICHHFVNSLQKTTLCLKTLPLTVSLTMRYNRFSEPFNQYLVEMTHVWSDSGRYA